MELYIRTSDKERLLRVDCVQYSKVNETRTKTNILGIKESSTTTRHYISCCGKRLGEYSSKERCLEIINEIQQKIKENSYQNTLVYDMPEI